MDYYEVMLVKTTKGKQWFTNDELNELQDNGYLEVFRLPMSWTREQCLSEMKKTDKGAIYLHSDKKYKEVAVGSNRSFCFNLLQVVRQSRT